VGQLIHLSERKADRSRPSCGPAAFFFALGCPISYLAAERVERALGEIAWVPVPLTAPAGRNEFERRLSAEEIWAMAEREAYAQRLPLVVPDGLSIETRAVSRAATFAAEQGAGRAFAVAAQRMIFCGGYDPADPEVITEAASAAGLSVQTTLGAACDEQFDASLDATARGLETRGVHVTPAIRVGQRWFEGFDAVPGASSFTAARALYGTPAS
jgi:2-hydroxychromene-2-carboxylate isomerase